MDVEAPASKCWLGSSITDICGGTPKWSFAVPPIIPSKYHHVLYHLPATLQGPPKPHFSSQPCHWDDDHVRMPYSEENLFPVKENGADVVKSRWKIITEVLSKPIKSIEDFEAAVNRYNSSLPKFLALQSFFDEELEEEEITYFFEHLLPAIIKLALCLPELVPSGIPLLKQNHNRSISLSQLQIACLLANAFLCTFPWRKGSASSYPGVNFVRLFCAGARPKRKSCIHEKFKCLFIYFRKVTKKTPLGVVTFERKFNPRSTMPRWDALDNNLGNTKIHISSEGTIEDNGLGFLQVDFANKNIGGGVLGYGCVQEEIRFIICPELIVGRLFVEQLGSQEAVIVIGVERFTNYSGYGDTFKWDGYHRDETPFDEYGRRRTSICIIDATSFNKAQDQFHCSSILRELNKAYVGFSAREKENLAPVATGNWGCGAFHGSKMLKSLIQLMACSAANRDLVYYSFGDEDLRDQFYNMHLFLANNRITITQLWRFLCQFTTTDLKEDKLYSFIQQAYFDSKKQPTIKKFFGTTGKVENNLPSTSTGENKKTPRPEKLDKNMSNGPNNQMEVDTIESMEVERNIMEIVEDVEDIIPSSQPEETSCKNTNGKTRTRSSLENITTFFPKTDTAMLIDLIDGNANCEKPKETNSEKKKPKVEEETCRKETRINMDEIKKCKNEDASSKKETRINGEQTKKCMNSFSETNVTAKKKITDYFTKHSNKSS